MPKRPGRPPPLLEVGKAGAGARVGTRPAPTEAAAENYVYNPLRAVELCSTPRKFFEKLD